MSPFQWPPLLSKLLALFSAKTYGPRPHGAIADPIDPLKEIHMRFQKTYLLTPGPVMMPPAVTEARVKQLPHHRTPQFTNLIKQIHEDIKPIFCTKNDVFSMTSAGSGAMESVVATLLSPGDTVICIDAGKFGNRWAKLCTQYGAEVLSVNVERGYGCTPEKLKQALVEHPQAKAVFGQLTETSTGVTFDIKALGEVVAKNSKAIYVVDAISALAAEPFLPDQWNVDVIVGGSQKGFMLPPGLSFASLSERSWQLTETAKNPSFYFDLRKYKKGYEGGQHPFTPNVGLYIQLAESIRLLREEGLENVWARHKWLADATRAGIKASGLEIFSHTPCSVLTAVKVPDGIDGGKLVKMMRDDLGVTIAGGQDELKGKIFRIAHLGYVGRFDILTALGALEIALNRLGYPVKYGTSIAAAQEVLANDPY